MNKNQNDFLPLLFCSLYYLCYNNTMEKLLLVDESALLFQSFYGMPNKIQTKSGEYIEAVVCFMGILRKVINNLQPNYVYVIFDGENKLSRQDEIPEYKTNRKDYSSVEDIDNPFLQLEKIKELLAVSQIKFRETDNCEADDYIASIVKAHCENVNIVIFSPDKDFYQLISPTVSIFHYRGKKSEIIDKSSFEKKFGFAPIQFADYLALLGDKADNISGVKGIGKVTAQKLVIEFQSIQNLLENVKRISSNNLKTLIIENKSKILKNYKVVNLNNNIPQFLQFSSLKYSISNFSVINYFNDK